MIRPVSAEDLLRGTREAAAAGNVRDAVRELALHALRSRPLTAAHIATVARTVGEGIASCDVPPTAPVRDAHRGAWAGLEDAVGCALLAVELAAREFAEGRAALGRDERERLLVEITRLDRELGDGWGYARAIPAPLHARIASATALLREAPACGEGAGDVHASVASGVLLGLTQERGTPAPNR
jgi:hypothetical protein